MPGESGLTLLSKVKALPHMPVIIMTAYSILTVTVAAFRASAFEYLPKPFDVDQTRSSWLRRAIDECPHQAGAEEVLSAVPDPGAGAGMQEVFRAIGRLSQSTPPC